MKYAIYRGDRAIVALAESEATPDQLPALRDGGYVEISDAQYDNAGSLFDRDGLPFFEESDGAVRRRGAQVKFWAVVDPDGNVQGGHVSRTGREPKHPATMRLLEVDQATYAQIDNQFLPESILPRWSVDENDNIVENADERMTLEVAVADDTLAVGDTAQITLTIRDAQGDVMPVTVRRHISVQHGTTMHSVAVQFTDGVAQVSRAMSEGIWSIVSTEPEVYRVTGNAVIRVSEAW